MIELNKIYNVDCLEGMKLIDDKSIDMILCDLPYGTTKCKWDVIIPFKPLWEQYERIIKDTGAIVLTSNEPFTSQLISSNLELYKYKWIWKKTKQIGFMNANYRPLKIFEEVCVFSKSPAVFIKNKNSMKYNPQGIMLSTKKIKRKNSQKYVISTGGNMESEYKQKYTNYPVDIIEFANTSKNNIHPTQKPVDLCEYLIKTYTNENELVLDNCAGSFTTAIACDNTNRNWICIEKEKEYCDLGLERINNNRKLLNIPLI